VTKETTTKEDQMLLMEIMRAQVEQLDRQAARNRRWGRQASTDLPNPLGR
jgi:hypothetical protein